MKVVELEHEWPDTCGACGGPYEPILLSAFEMIVENGQPLCADCAELRCPTLAAMVRARAGVPFVQRHDCFPHDYFNLHEQERQRVRRRVLAAGN